MNLINTLSELIVTDWNGFLLASSTVIVLAGFITVLGILLGWLIWLMFDGVKEVIQEIKK
jgi:hypothetical protein